MKGRAGATRTCHTRIYTQSHIDQAPQQSITPSTHKKVPSKGSLKCLQTSRSKTNAYRSCIIDDFITSCAGRITEMTKRIECHTREKLPDVYRLAVILVICGIFEVNANTQSLTIYKVSQQAFEKL